MSVMSFVTIISRKSIDTLSDVIIDRFRTPNAKNIRRKKSIRTNMELLRKINRFNKEKKTIVHSSENLIF